MAPGFGSGPLTEGRAATAKFGDSDVLKCSFCGKTQKQVKHLIAGPGVYICDDCIDLCNEVIEDGWTERGLDPPWRRAASIARAKR